MAVDLGDLIESEIAAAYERGDPIQAIADRYGCCYNTVRNIAARHNVPPRTPGNKWKEPSAEQVDLAIKLWNENLSLSYIGSKVGLTAGNVARVLHDQGVKTEKRGKPTGKYAGNWKGGRRIVDGYVKVLLQDYTPYASMRQGNGYVLEHRLVMAEHLGRALTSDETVHHINGNTTDNRIENLQLRIGAHGPNVAMKCNQCGSADISATELGGQ